MRFIKNLDVCAIGKNSTSDTAHLIRTGGLIIWGEAPTTHTQVFQYLDTALRDVTGVALFGGNIVVLGGDFRQTPGVTPQG